MFAMMLMKYIFMEDRKLRFYFLEDGGIEIINEFLKTDDVEIVHEVLLIIDDLIHEHLELSEYTSYSKIVIEGMIEYLRKVEIEKSLYELLQQTQKNRLKYEKIDNDLKNLILSIECHQYIKQPLKN
jgi:hypothetical protein